MRPYFRIIIGLFIAWFGFKAVRQAYSSIDVGLLSEFQYFPFILLIIATIIALALDTKYFELDRKIYQYSLSFVGVILSAIVISKFIQNSSTDNSKTVLQISNLPGATNVLNFEFKENGKFRLTGYNKLGQTIYHGKYSRNRDTINIISSNYSGYAKQLPQTGLIQNDTVYWSGFDIMLVDKK
jgi:hypothetical protein